MEPTPQEDQLLHLVTSKKRLTSCLRISGWMLSRKRFRAVSSSYLCRTIEKQFEPHNCLVVLEERKQGIQNELNQPVFVVDLVLLRCSCQYTWKTGLPCWHLLSVAAKSPTTTYTSLIHKRWRTQTTTGVVNKS